MTKIEGGSGCAARNIWAQGTAISQTEIRKTGLHRAFPVRVAIKPCGSQTLASLRTQSLVAGESRMVLLLSSVMNSRRHSALSSPMTKQLQVAAA